MESSALIVCRSRVALSAKTAITRLSLRNDVLPRWKKFWVEVRSGIVKQLHFASIWHLRYRFVRGAAGTFQPHIHHRSLDVLRFPAAAPHLHDLMALFWTWLEFSLELNGAPLRLYVFTLSHSSAVNVQWHSRVFYWFIQMWTATMSRSNSLKLVH